MLKAFPRFSGPGLHSTGCTTTCRWSVGLFVQGPIGAGSSSEALTAHREGLLARTPFDRDGFVRDIAVLLGSKLEVIHVVKKGPRTVVDVSESRAYHFDGATIFQLNLAFLVNGTADACQSSYAVPIYECPQNTYRFLYGCVTYGLTATSATASLEACQACASVKVFFGCS